MRRLQRVAVHAAVVVDGRLLVVDGALPWTVLAHGETPAAALRRTLGDGSEAEGLLAVHDGRREVEHAGGPVDVHTVHLVLAARAPRPPTGEWLDVAGRGERWPLVADALVAVEEAELRRLAPGEDPDVPVVRQRLACYAVVVADGALLLTRLSPLTPSPGRWTLPGGGVDHGEHPVAAVVREVHEETGMDVEVTGLAEVGSEHFTGRSPRGVLEDFHAVRILVTATPTRVRVPEVLDVGGSTDLARWVPFEEMSGVGLVGVAQRGLTLALSRDAEGSARREP
ncbi:ADP-ribose pyrophosphatase YjhB (NUDIX family) [Kineococcus radiotolerans]|uniref:ADP-ribose pyrophosphatase YjhB (NUDIX family) n=1 Tax=Kineococcus radiotolerans TaxID=131568 RepID=A0A7W4XW71_KINRA|nr:NUDIX hydrolase [Kineococcus radiotolerans]MBB2900588.1 ADP-ribose pyrophosphatase YjhB (NUDIX family) [Kineococcus radiotolerans]